MADSGMLAGKVVAVTGAGGGIGRAIALHAAAAGAAVVVNDIGTSLSGAGQDASAADGVVAEIRATGGRAVASHDSVATAEGAARIVQAATDSFGRLDGVVNNAGILRDGFFHKMTEEAWDAVLKVHLYGSFHVARAAAPVFQQQNGGAMVHMTSTSGLIGNLAQANYAAAKLGIVGLSRSVALDMRKFGVRSNCIAPFAWSRMVSSIKADTPEAQERLDRISLMTVDKVAPLAVYLLADAAAGVTGQIFCIRHNEISIMSQPRPLRSIHRGEGWTPATIAGHAMPALRSHFTPLEVSNDVFGWDPV